MRRVLVVALLALALLVAPAAADDWSSAQPVPDGGSVPVALGQIYDMSFWAPNRGVLMTAGGLWAYDGTGWHHLSTVCGGTGGRVVWAGPLDFWTISDQPVGQDQVSRSQTWHRSLCHFVNGAVVASYAQPIGQDSSYQPMNAGACLGPDDCWFGGERLPGTFNAGAFHLHWDGRNLTPVPALTAHDPSIDDPDRAVADMTTHQGALYESVTIGDNDIPGEPDDQPFLLHQIVDGTPPSFVAQFPNSGVDYGGQAPRELDPLRLSSDGSTLWAAAGTQTQDPVPVTVLRDAGGGFDPLRLVDPAHALPPETQINDIGAEPGTDDAWIAYAPAAERSLARTIPARLARVHSDGTVDSVTTLRAEGDGLSRKGVATTVTCPAPGQCWMATTSGWLFHLGGDLPRDDAPEMHRLITYRPPDASTIVLPPDTLPDDDSGVAPPVFSEPPPLTDSPGTDTERQPRARKLVTGIRRRLVHRTTLELTFTLTAKAHVQLVAKRRSKVVARTKKTTLKKGRHKLRLRLSPKRWPTKLDFRVTAYSAPDSDTDTTTTSGRRDPSAADDNPDAPGVTIASVRSRRR